MSYEVIYKPQTEKDLYNNFKKYRMSCLVIINKKEKFKYEVKIKDYSNTYTEFNISRINDLIKKKGKEKRKINS